MLFLWPCSLAVPVLAGLVYAFSGSMSRNSRRLNRLGSGFTASQKMGQRLKVSSDRLGEAGNRTCDPWLTRHRFIPYTTAASLFNVWHRRKGILVTRAFLFRDFSGILFSTVNTCMKKNQAEVRIMQYK